MGRPYDAPVPRITPDDVAHVARLARLDLTDDELGATPASSPPCSSHAADIEALDLADVAPTTHPYPLLNVLRADVVGARASTATRCWPRPRRSRTAASGCRRSSGRRRDRRSSIAAAVRVRASARPARWSRSTSAGIDAREAELHAFNLVLADEARAAAAAIDAAVAAGEDPGPLAGVPVALKDNLCTRGIPTTCSSRILEGWRPPYDATVVERLAAAGAVVVGKTNLDEFAMGSSTENSAFGPDPQPARLDPGARRLVGRQRGRGGGRLRAARPRLRHRRVDPPAGRPVRRGRDEADLRARSAATGWSPSPRSSTRSARSPRTVADAATLLEVIGGHDPLDSTSIPEPAPRSSARRSADGVEGLRVGVVTELGGRGHRRPTCWPASGEAAAALEAAGAKVDEVSVPAVVYGLTAYYLIAPAEASSNLARYDGVRYGLRVDAADTAAMNAATPHGRASAPR